MVTKTLTCSQTRQPGRSSVANKDKLRPNIKVIWTGHEKGQLSYNASGNGMADQRSKPRGRPQLSRIKTDFKEVWAQVGDIQGRAKWRSKIAVLDPIFEPRGIASKQHGMKADFAVMRAHAGR